MGGKRGVGTSWTRACDRAVTASAEKALCSASGLQADCGRGHFSKQVFCCHEIGFFYDPVWGQKNIFNLFQLWGRKTLLSASLSSLSLPYCLGLEWMKQLCAMQCDGQPKRYLWEDQEEGSSVMSAPGAHRTFESLFSCISGSHIHQRS